jgi:hypothetical protein
VRDDDDFWQHVESYIETHTGAQFSHGVCPSCYERVTATDTGRVQSFVCTPTDDQAAT